MTTSRIEALTPVENRDKAEVARSHSWGKWRQDVRVFSLEPQIVGVPRRHAGEDDAAEHADKTECARQYAVARSISVGAILRGRSNRKERRGCPRCAESQR